MQSGNALVRSAVVCLLLILPVSSLAALTCKGDGCIIPLNLNLPYSNNFHSVCNKLDTCYYCGSVRGVSRKQCDRQFFQDMVHSCSFFDATCKTYAWIQYFAVVVGAESYWVQHCPPWCQESWVSDCLPPEHKSPPPNPYKWKMFKPLHTMSS